MKASEFAIDLQKTRNFKEAQLCKDIASQARRIITASMGHTEDLLDILQAQTDIFNGWCQGEHSLIVPVLSQLDIPGAMDADDLELLQDGQTTKDIGAWMVTWADGKRKTLGLALGWSKVQYVGDSYWLEHNSSSVNDPIPLSVDVRDSEIEKLIRQAIVFPGIDYIKDLLFASPDVPGAIEYRFEALKNYLEVYNS